MPRSDPTLFRNPAWRPSTMLPDAGVDTGPGHAAMAFHRLLPGYRPTPLVDAPALAGELGVEKLWVKDETTRLGLPAFKMLGASWAVYRVLAERAGGSFDRWTTLGELREQVDRLGDVRLVAATDGNHGRAVARMAKLLGLGAAILVPEGTAPARMEAILSEGATLEIVPGTYDDAVVRSAEVAAEDPTGTVVVSDTSWPGYQQVPGWVIDGYGTMFAEADEQGANPTRVVIQMGVGALTAAAVTHYRPLGTRVGVVEPVDAACGLRSAQAGRPALVPGPHRSVMAGLNCGAVSLLAWPIIAAGVDVFVTVSDADAEQAVRDLAGIGIRSGETGAAGLAGVRALADARPDGPLHTDDRVLIVCTEGPTDPAAFWRITGQDG